MNPQRLADADLKRLIDRAQGVPADVIDVAAVADLVHDARGDVDDVGGNALGAVDEALEVGLGGRGILIVPIDRLVP